jgi:hypothetical protein
MVKNLQIPSTTLLGSRLKLVSTPTPNIEELILLSVVNLRTRDSFVGAVEIDLP